MGFGGKGQDLDHSLTPKVSGGACLGVLLIILGVAEIMTSLRLWTIIAAGDAAHAPPQQLALDQAHSYSFPCATADVAAAGILRGIVLSARQLPPSPTRASLPP